MQRLNIDSIGPLSLDGEGHKHIVVIIDTFTRYVTLCPAKSLEAKEGAQILFKHICRFGVPDEIQSDNGPQFVNKDLQELFGLTSISHIRVIPYSHQENGIVERVNKEVNRHLRNIIFDNRVYHSWSAYLPMVERIINTTRHSETGQVPAHLVFGKIGINLDRHILTTPSTDVQDIVEPSTYGAQLLQQQQTLIDIARTHQEEQIQERLRKQQTEPLTVFEAGSYVLRQHPKGRTSKLDPKHIGPFVVVSQNQNNCTIKDQDGKQTTVHIKELRPYHLNGQDRPEDIALRDKKLFIVESIVRHRTPNNKTINNRNKTATTFLVK
jgi:hypothetical protein